MNKADASVKSGQPKVSVIMPTFNSAKTIRQSLESVRAQTYPKELIEIILADGGSTDGTLDIAKEFGCRVLHNARLQPECGKQIGMENAVGKYAVFLDSDEVLQRHDAFEKKVAFLESDKVAAKNFVTAGLLNPDNYADINDYTNRYGDPFSAFIYGIDGGDYFDSLKRLYRVIYNDGDVLVVEFNTNNFLPIVDGGGHFYDLSYIKSLADVKDMSVVPNVFNIVVGKTHQLGVLKGDFIVHYSTVSLKKYVQKIRWRIVSNLFYSEEVGAGFQVKQQFQPRSFTLKKYLFIPYSLTLVLPVLKSLQLLMRHKKPIYLLHGPLSWLTGAMILYYTALKFLKVKPKLGAYGK